LKRALFRPLALAIDRHESVSNGAKSVKNDELKLVGVEFEKIPSSYSINDSNKQHEICRMLREQKPFLRSSGFLVRCGILCGPEKLVKRGGRAGQNILNIEIEISCNVCTDMQPCRQNSGDLPGNVVA
jgi:hypothetical protein